MIAGKKPACTSTSSREKSTGGQVHFRTNSKTKENELQQNISLVGNRCGHILTNPLFFVPPKNHKRRFPPIERSKIELRKSYSSRYRYEFEKVFYNSESITKKGAYRRVRSERREAITHRVGQVLFHYGNLEKGMFGRPINHNKFDHYGMKFISKHAGVSEKRTRASLKILEKFGYIKIEHQKDKKIDGSYRSSNAKITINPAFYYDLGVSEKELQQYGRKQKQEDLQTRSHAYFISKRNGKNKINEIKDGLYKRENPGKDRRRENAPIYRDYTGISKNKEYAKSKDSIQTAHIHLQNIMHRLKPKIVKS